MYQMFKIDKHAVDSLVFCFKNIMINMIDSTIFKIEISIWHVSTFTPILLCLHSQWFFYIFRKGPVALKLGKIIDILVKLEKPDFCENIIPNK
jgi:hypothetical protein